MIGASTYQLFVTPAQAGAYLPSRFRATAPMGFCLRRGDGAVWGSELSS
jgi:hypothetical protein